MKRHYTSFADLVRHAQELEPEGGTAAADLAIAWLRKDPTLFTQFATPILREAFWEETRCMIDDFRNARFLLNDDAVQ